MINFVFRSVLVYAIVAYGLWKWLNFLVLLHYEIEILTKARKHKLGIKELRIKEVCRTSNAVWLFTFQLNLLESRMLFHVTISKRIERVYYKNKSEGKDGKEGKESNVSHSFVENMFY